MKELLRWSLFGPLALILIIGIGRRMLFVVAKSLLSLLTLRASVELYALRARIVLNRLVCCVSLGRFVLIMYRLLVSFTVLGVVLVRMSR